MRTSVWLLAFALLATACSSSSDDAHTKAPTITAPKQCGTVRTHYIAADAVAWNYTPSGRNVITAKQFGPIEETYEQQAPDRIGSTYMKSQYREYTDATFTHLAPVSDHWVHLGILGPVIHAEIGDTIKVVFKNDTPFPASMHPHGVFYAKTSEGAGYNDDTSGAEKADDSIAPGHTYTYVWEVPERAGPGPMDPSSIMWMYHSHVDEPADTNAGLMGPIIVTRCGNGRADGSPKDVDREFVTMFSVMDENVSLWRDRNIAKYALDPKSVKVDDPEFVESNLMHSINGYSYGNLPGLDMRQGDHVRWYLMGMGTEVDLHTPHWHGNTVVTMGMRTDVVSLLPATMVVADMTPDDPGTWLFHCHVNDHLVAGMSALYTVASAHAPG